MPIKSYRPTTPTRRFQTIVSRADITKEKPEKSLVSGKKRSGGRDGAGQIAVRFRGGGAKRRYRQIDFKRDHRIRSEPLGPHRSASLCRR